MVLISFNPSNTRCVIGTRALIEERVALAEWLGRLHANQVVVDLFLIKGNFIKIIEVKNIILGY